MPTPLSEDSVTLRYMQELGQLSDVRTRDRRETGAAAVEFALVLPLLMLIIFGIIQFGFVMAQSAALSNGARAGARYGVVNILSDHNCGGVVAQVRQATQTIGLVRAKVAVTVKRGSTLVCSSPANSETVTNASSAPCTVPVGVTDNDVLNVQATYISPTLVPIGLNDFNLEGDATFRCEYK